MNDYTCKRCGGILLNGRRNYCEKCVVKNKEDLKIVREYIETHKHPTIMEISLDTGISLKIISNLVKNESLSIIE